MLVVAAAIVREGMVLAAQRSYPPDLAGQWEFPGGKVESDEKPRDALIREICEELGVLVAVHERLGADVRLPADAEAERVPAEAERVPADARPIRAGADRIQAAGRLRLYRCSLVDASAQPVARDHRSVRWVDAAALAALPWLITNRQLLPHVFRVLGAPH